MVRVSLEVPWSQVKAGAVAAVIAVCAYILSILFYDVLIVLVYDRTGYVLPGIVGMMLCATFSIFCFYKFYEGFEDMVSWLKKVCGYWRVAVAMIAGGASEGLFFRKMPAVMWKERPWAYVELAILLPLFAVSVVYATLDRRPK